MSVKQQITDNLADAVKSQQEPQRTVLRGLLSAIRNAEIEKGGELDESGLISLLRKQVKQREESAAAYRSRPELAKQEEAEAVIIKAYLPQEMDQAELAGLVEEAIKQTGASSMADMGKIMGVLQPKVAGRADGGQIAALVKEKLG